MKQEGVPFLYASISLAYFKADKGSFSKHAEADQKIHHAYKKRSVNWNFRFLQYKDYKNIRLCVLICTFFKKPNCSPKS